MKLRRTLSLALLLLASTAARGAAQTMQGLIHEEDPQNNRELYGLRVRQEVTGLLGQWKRAWDRNADGEAAALYAREGVFVSARGDEVSGRDELRRSFATIFGTAGTLRFGLIDFDFSGELAFVRGQMAWSDTPAGGAEVPQVRNFVLIAKRQRGDIWLIRSLMLAPAVLEPVPAAATSTPPPAAPPAPAAAP
jgi:uncharacterized protein (TIGR02246 family)